MDTGGVITFLIVVVYIVSVLFKFKKKILKDGKIDIASVLDKIKQMQIGTSDALNQSDAKKATFLNEQEVQADVILNKKKVSLKQKQIKPVRKTNIPPRKAYEEEILQGDCSFGFYHSSRKFELKKAVIFSEIISSPLGLRSKNYYDKF